MESGMTEKGNGRLVHYDLLRIFACFSVIMLHASAQFWYSMPVTDHRWLVANSYDAVFRFGVPVFVMISGALFLMPERKVALGKLYKHNILRLFTAFVVWSCAYGLWDCRRYEWDKIDWRPFALEMLGGRYHLWFVPMLIGIYMLLPVLKTWMDHTDKKGVEYFLALFLVCQILKETALVFIPSANVREVVGMLQVEMACSYVGYFVLGYYLAHWGLNGKLHKWVYVAGAVGLAGAVFFGNVMSLRAGEPQTGAFDSYSLFTFCVVVAVFLFFQEVVGRITFSAGWCRAIREVSAATFGIYLIHVLVIEALEGRGISSMTINNVAGIPLLAVLCLVIGYLVIAVIRRIPVVGKYIT